MTKKLIVVVAIIAIAIVAIWAVWFRGPKVAKIEIFAEPSTLIADGKSTAVVTVKIFDAEDNPIPKRTVELKLSYTYKGGRLKKDKLTTNEEGKADTTFVAGTKAGNRKITASAGGKSKSVTLTLTEKE